MVASLEPSVVASMVAKLVVERVDGLDGKLVVLWAGLLAI